MTHAPADIPPTPPSGQAAPEPAPPADPDRPSRFSGRLELILVTLLGIVSLAIAYATFESGLYNGNMASAYARGNSLRTEAESLYLEGNQQFSQDAQTIAQLEVLKVAADAGDATASAQHDRLYFVSVSTDLDAAIKAAAALDAADPATWHDPQADTTYQASLFGSYTSKLEESTTALADGATANFRGDQLTLFTVLMAVTLFLLGVAAVLRRTRVKIILAGIGVAIFAVALGLTLTVPFIWLG